MNDPHELHRDRRTADTYPVANHEEMARRLRKLDEMIRRKEGSRSLDCSVLVVRRILEGEGP